MIQSFDISPWIGERPMELIHLTQKVMERKHANHWNENPNPTEENRGYPYMVISLMLLYKNNCKSISLKIGIALVKEWRHKSCFCTLCQFP
jgi:hypothetical protein